jgi:hypothetical protein
MWALSVEELQPLGRAMLPEYSRLFSRTSSCALANAMADWQHEHQQQQCRLLSHITACCCYRSRRSLQGTAMLSGAELVANHLLQLCNSTRYHFNGKIREGQNDSKVGRALLDNIPPCTLTHEQASKHLLV